jgi:prevent-host-death family protein
MATRITATELARNLSDVLNRVRYKGESFEVTRGGETIAEIKATERKRFTVADFIDFWENVPKPDPEFWDDVEWAHNLMNEPLPEPPAWDC